MGQPHRRGMFQALGQAPREVRSAVTGAFGGAARNDEVGRVWAPPSAWYDDEPGERPPRVGARRRLRACWSLCKHVAITAFSCAVAAVLSD